MAGERILLVDDEAFIRDLCSRILSSQGYAVTAAASGGEALAELERNPADLLISDIQMPGMDGLELFKRVRAAKPDIVTVLITGHGTLETAIESLMMGVEGFLLKPFTREGLLSNVDRAMKRSRLQKENIRLKALIPLFEISKLLVTEIDPEHLFKIIAEVVRQEFSAERVSLMLADPATGDLLVRASHGLPEEVALQARRRHGEGVAGLVVARREPLIITKGGHPDAAVASALNRDELPLSSLCVPLIGRDRVLGVLNVSKFHDPTFTGSDLQIASILASQVAAAMENAALYEGLRESYFRTVHALVAAVEAKDPYTRWHSTNVAKYAVAIGRDRGLSPLQLEEIHIAAILHDVGKIGISERIIDKPEGLSDEEFTVMKDHPSHGMRILEPLGFAPAIVDGIFQHHERYDGTGYPRGLKGDRISLTARILTVADTIDAMISARPYHRGISEELVLRELERESGRQFDPEIAGSARRLIEGGLIQLGMQTPAPQGEPAERK